MTLLSLTQDNDFYRLDEGWSRLPYFIAGFLFILFIIWLIKNEK